MNDPVEEKLGPALRTILMNLAETHGLHWFDMIEAVSQRPLVLTPADTGGKTPLPIGTEINLTRGLPGTPQGDDENLGWIVAGYLSRKGKWSGYDLRKGKWQLRTATVSDREVFEVVT